MDNITLIECFSTRFNLTEAQAQNLLAFLQDEDIMDAEVEETVYSHYMDSGEMPYGVAKARDGDPAEWIADQLTKEYDL